MNPLLMDRTIAHVGLLRFECADSSKRPWVWQHQCEHCGQPEWLRMAERIVGRTTAPIFISDILEINGSRFCVKQTILTEFIAERCA